MRNLVLVLMLSTIFLVLACGEDAPEETTPAETVDTSEEITIPEEDPQVDMVTASHILISYEGCGLDGIERTQEEARDLINEIESKIVSNEMTFAEAAIEYSDCPSGASGGDLGTFGRGAMVAPFEDAAFALAQNEVSGIVETQFGYHLILRTE